MHNIILLEKHSVTINCYVRPPKRQLSNTLLGVRLYNMPYDILERRTDNPQRRFLLFSFLIVVALIVWYSPQILLAQQQAVTEVTVVANPQAYKGPCPGKLKFTGTMYVSRYPMTLNYQWERSDGAKGPVRVVHIPNAKTRSITVVDYWQVGASGQHLQVWERLRVRTGNTDITSSPATVTISCR